MRRTLGDSEGIPGAFTFSEYCRSTLYNLGMIHKEQSSVQERGRFPWTYRLSLIGEHYLPLVAFALDWSVRHHQSLFGILGSTCSSGTSRAPSNRVKLLESLV